MFLRRPSSQTNLLSLPQRTLVTDELTQSLTKTVHQRLTYPVFQSQCTFVRDELISLVFHKGPSSHTNLLSLSQWTFVTNKLSQAFTKDLRHRRTLSVFHKGPSSETKLFSPLSQRTFVTDELTLSSTNDLDELTQCFTKDLRHRLTYSVFHKGPVSETLWSRVAYFDSKRSTLSSLRLALF